MPDKKQGNHEVDLRYLEKRGCTERVQQLRQFHFKHRPSVCLHRSRIYTGIYRDTESEPTVLRRAKAFKRFCEEKPIFIQEGELIIGHPTCKPRGVSIYPDFSWQWISEELDQLSTREQDPYNITEAEKQELREEIFPYWKGKSVYEFCLGHLPPETRRLSYKTGFIDNEVKQINGMGHCVPGYGNQVLPKGFKGIAAEARESLARLSYEHPDQHERIEFLQAAIICCEGMKILAERHAAEARKLAEKEANQRRRDELLKIAEVCAWVPDNPPRNFHEAVQAVWLTQVGAYMEQGGPGLGLGRFDQYMYPYFQADLAAGRLTKEDALELMECLWIKQAEIVWLLDEMTSHFFAGYQLFLGCNIGGLTRDGREAANELTYLCIDATDDLRLHSPSLAARVHHKSSDKYLTRIAELVKTGIGYPQIHNDDVGIPMMLSCGASVEDAYDYDVMGCSEAQIQGKMWKYSDAGQFNMAACLEFALNDGYSRMVPDEKRWGLPTGDPRQFKTYAEVEEAFKKQLAYFTEHLCVCNMVTERAHATVAPYPFASLLFEGPVESGIDLTQGGVKYNVGPAPSYIGLADVVNSLASIKKLVFEDKALTMPELIDCLDNNFAGREEIRLMLLNRGPKYGRDDPYADDIAKEIADYTAEISGKYTSIRNCKFVSAMFPVAANTPLGLIVGALPSGRAAEKPLADGVSPQQGTDRSPTEVIKSVTAYDHVRHQNGLLLNMKFNPTVLKDETGTRNFISLVRTFFELGGWHIQFNVVDSEVLREAQQHPEKYPGLMVRVAGYSAYFNDLSRETQDDIISRTEHCAI